MKTYIITRYNVCLYSTARKHKGRAESWMEERFQMFSKFCAPSVRAQTVKDFEWIFLFDAKTPTRYLKKVKRQLDGINYNFIFVTTKSKRFKERNVDGLDSLSLYIHNTGKAIMMRLDNDDALARNAVETIKSFAERHPDVGTVVDAARFYIHDEARGDCYCCEHGKVGAPVIALVVNTKKPTTVYDKSHFKMAHMAHRNGKLVRIKNVPLWMMTIHDKNCTNGRYAKSVIDNGEFKDKVKYDKIKEMFGC